MDWLLQKLWFRKLTLCWWGACGGEIEHIDGVEWHCTSCPLIRR